MGAVRSQTTDLLDLAVRTAAEAGALLRGRFGAPARGISSKSSLTDMVSDSDRDAEALIASRILAARPEDGMLGEERGERPGTSGLRWVVDPLDGTTNFLYGIPHWCVSIACEDAEGVVVGVVHDPNRSETFAATRGGGATCNGSPVRVSDCDDLSRALVATGFGYLASERKAQGAVVASVLPRVRDIRRCGAAALDLAWVAAGRVDGYYETPMNAWDVAAGLLLVHEAGGLTGELRNGGAVAATPRIFDRLMTLLREEAQDRP